MSSLEELALHEFTDGRIPCFGGSSVVGETMTEEDIEVLRMLPNLKLLDIARWKTLILFLGDPSVLSSVRAIMMPEVNWESCAVGLVYEEEYELWMRCVEMCEKLPNMEWFVFYDGFPCVEDHMAVNHRYVRVREYRTLDPVGTGLWSAKPKKVSREEMLSSLKDISWAASGWT